jgi:hypothetical protein
MEEKKEERPLEGFGFSAILKEMEFRFDNFCVASTHSVTETDEDGVEVEKEVFDCAFNGSKTVALGILHRSIISLENDIVAEFWRDEDEPKDEDDE